MGGTGAMVMEARVGRGLVVLSANILLKELRLANTIYERRF